MAERVGFEPTNELPRCWFSRPVLSTAQPPLHWNNCCIYYYQSNEITMIKCNNFLCFLIDTKYDNKKNVKNN